MVDELKLLSGDNYKINDKIEIIHPTLSMIKDYGEQKYFSIISNLVAIPSDMKSILFDAGYDYEKISDFELFIMLCKNLKKEDTSIIFGENIELNLLYPFINNEIDQIFLSEVSYFIDEIIILDEEELNKFIFDIFGEIKDDIRYKIFDIIKKYKSNEINIVEFKSFFDKSVFDLKLPKSNGIKIDFYIHMLISDYLRQIHGFEKKIEFAGNEYTKQIMIDLDREDRKIKAEKEFKSILAPLIIALVNCADFSYNFKDIWDLPISVFMNSVKQVRRYQDFKFTMNGIYSGSIDIKKIKNKKDLDWI